MVRKVLVEVVSVVFAVLLALGLNHWREAANDQQLADNALYNIIVEIKKNVRELETEMDDYQVALDSLQAEFDRVENGQEFTKSFGYSHPLLNNAAWNTANSTGAVKDIDPEILMALSEIYIYQEMYLDNGFSYFKEFTKPRLANPLWDHAFAKSLMQQTQISMALGTGLMETCTEFLEKYDDRLPKVEIKED